VEQRNKRNGLEKSACLLRDLSCFDIRVITLHRTLLNDTLPENIILKNFIPLLLIVASNKRRKNLCNEKDQMLLSSPDIITGRSRFTTFYFTTFHIKDCFKILP
jgi:hypothetical protein